MSLFLVKTWLISYMLHNNMHTLGSAPSEIVSALSMWSVLIPLDMRDWMHELIVKKLPCFEVLKGMDMGGFLATFGEQALRRKNL